ncbi:MAG: protein phosphatase 2C domain-containing protein [Burkholderiales bacterium]|jgi:serine/threonine protein phosphatase PrpC|nr:protein phosphatase 2C domain-containing protein [Burkholderiales bacterium]
MPRFKVTACTAEHIGDRPDQQDRVAVLTSPRHPNSVLAVVSDGMGGRTGGRMAADQVIATVTHVYRDLGEDDAGSPTGLLKAMAEEAHTVIRLSALSSEKEPHATFVALLVRSDCAAWAHAGDSRLYHFRDCRLMHRTEDHTYASYLRAQGRAEQALEAERRYKHMLVSSLGLARRPDLLIEDTDDLRSGDSFLLCSDGLWSYFGDDELGETLANLNPREASNELVSLARQRARGAGDNLSLAIVKLEPPQ